jgi:arylsulfatase A-like enzyme
VGGTDGGTPTARPNVIFVLSDDLSWNLVKHMPNLLKMQQQGATFSNYFVSDSLCCPSRTSMFTGKFPHNSGVFTNTGDDGGYATYLKLGNDPQTFAVALRKSGYRTAMLGKFLNGYEPTMNPAAQGWTGWDVAGNGYPEFNYDLNEDGQVVHYGKTDADYLTDVLSGLGQKFIKQKAAKPFLIELATFAPHAPYIPAPRHAALFSDLTYPTTPAFNARPTATDPAWLQGIPALKPAQITNIDEIFRQRVRSVQAIDEMIGALQVALKATGHDKDTYLFFASDNGYHMGERSQTPGKQTAFDTDIHVPLIVTGPGVLPGLQIPEIAQNIDLCPTFADLAQTPAPATVNGHSLVQLAHGEPVSDWRNVALIEHHDPKFDPNDPDADTSTAGAKNPPTYNALRTANSVYVEYVSGEREYHDRTTDPYELDNTEKGLPTAQLTRLRDTLTAITTCKTADACWTAQHMNP